MRFRHIHRLGDMLGAAGVAGEAADDGEGIELIDTLKAFKSRLPRPIQGWLPTDLPSALLVLAYAWTTLVGFGFVYVSVVNWQTYAVDVVLVLPVLLVGLAGLWRPRTLWVLVPAGLIWLGLAVVSTLTSPRNPMTAATFGAAVVVGIWAVARRTRDLESQRRAASKTTNQLGWDLHSLATEPPITDEALDQIGVYRDLRIGEVQRHFDQVTLAAIQGGLQHAFRLRGASAAVHGLPMPMGNTRTVMSLQGLGTSSVQLGMSGTISDELIGEAFVAVLERSVSVGVDTVRVVVPSERQARLYVSQLLSFWSGRLGPNTASELMLRRYAGAIAQAISSDSSYVADRLSAILRLPAAERPPVTVIGESLDRHAVLAGAIRFGSDGPLFQLFPIALVRSLLALIEGRPLPPGPSSSTPPTALAREVEPEAESSAQVASNGHVSGLQMRTFGGLRLTAGVADVTSALMDRKVLAFLWIYLLARKLRNPEDTITRASLADELSPGLDGSTQRSRLRGRLSELRNELPPSLGRRVQVQGERISLDLTDAEVDLQSLMEAARASSASAGVLSKEQLTRLESLLADTQGVFLPDWDDLEQHVNSGRGGAGEVVNELRRRSEAAMTALLRTLGTAYMAHGSPEAAVALLERALQISPEDEATVRSLVAACMQTGRLTRAEELRKDFSLV